MFYINVPDINDSVGRVTIEKTEYYIRFTYNPAYDYWSFGLYDVNMEPIMPMNKIVPMISLLHYYVYTDLPPGAFGCIAKSDKVGRNDFVNGKASFVYLTEDDVEMYEKYKEAQKAEDTYIPVAVDNP